MLEEREDAEAEARKRIEPHHRFGRLARGVEQRDAVEYFALRIGERHQFVGKAVAPDVPQRLTAHMIHMFDVRQIPVIHGLRGELAQPHGHAAASPVARERERRPLPGQPDDLALGAGRDLEAGWRVVIQGSVDPPE
jgi:hypothetical protein